MNQNFHQRMLQQAQQIAFLQQQIQTNTTQQPIRRIRRNFDVVYQGTSKERETSKNSNQSNPYGKKLKKQKMQKSVSQTGFPSSMQLNDQTITSNRKDINVVSPLKSSSKIGSNIQLVLKSKKQSVGNDQAIKNSTVEDPNALHQYLNLNIQTQPNSRNQQQSAATTTAKMKTFYSQIAIKSNSPEKSQSSNKIIVDEAAQQYGQGTNFLNTKLKHSASESAGQTNILLRTESKIGFQNNSVSRNGQVLTQQISLSKLQQPQLQLDRNLLEKLIKDQNNSRQNSNEYNQAVQHISRNNSSRNGNFTGVSVGGEPILNIRSAKDINIYNNSFILSSALNTSQSLNSKQSFDRIKTTADSRRPTVPESHLVNQNNQKQQRSSSLSKNQSASQNYQNINNQQDLLQQQQNSGRVMHIQKLPQNAVQLVKNVKDQRRQIALKRVSKAESSSVEGLKNSINLSRENLNSNETNLSVKNILSFKQSKSNQSAHTTRDDVCQKARIFINKKQYKEALQILESIKTEEANFLKGICYLDSGESILNAKAQFQQCQTLPDAFIMLAICEKKIGNHAASLQLIDNCIERFPNYSEGYLMKAQHLTATARYKLALAVYQTCQLSPEVNTGMGECYKMLKKYDQAIEQFTLAINQLKKPIQTTEIKIQRGITYFSQKKYLDALKDFQDVLLIDPSNIKVHFYLGRVLSMGVSNYNSKMTDIMLHFELVARSDNELLSGNALYQIAKLNIAEKRFNEAHYALTRAADNHFQSKRLTLLQDFTEAVVQLMKRKIKKGVQILSDLIEILKENDYLFFKALNYRAYGFVAIEKYDQALADIKKVKKVASDLDTNYNKYLAKGILRMDNEDYLMASKYFNKAWKLFPQNKDAYCLQVISIVKSYTYSLYGFNIDQQIKFDKVLETKQFLDKAISNCYEKKESSLFFFRGLLNFQLHNFYESVLDFNEAIQNEEESTPMYYLARGRSYACLSMLNEAMKEISIALNLDETLQQGYIFRGCSAYLMGDNNLAFLDFQRLILSDPKNPMVHVQAGKLLMTTGAFQDAIKAFENADTLEITPESHFQKARCFIALNDIDKALTMFEQTLQVCQDDMLLNVDLQICELLIVMRKCSKVIYATNSKPEEIQLSQQELEKVCSSFKDLINLYESGKLQQIKKQDAPLSIKLIPNSDRLKIERTLINQQNNFSSELETSREDTKKQDTKKQKNKSQHLKQQEIINLFSELESLPNVNCYYECIYSLKDMYLYKGIALMYLNRYDEAVKDFIQFENCKTDELSLTILSSLDSEQSENSKIKTDSTYNILICQLLMKDNSSAKVTLELLDHQTKNSNLVQFKKDINEFITKGKVQKGICNLFDNQERLCTTFQPIKLGDQNLHLSFGLPQLRPPNMIPSVDENIIQSEFSLKQIDAPMPEAPWINKQICQHKKIIYTTDIKQATTPKYFQQVKQKEEIETNDISVKARILKNENFKKEQMASLVSDSEEQIIFDQKCSHKECQASKLKQQQLLISADIYDKGESSNGSLLGADETLENEAIVADSLVRIQSEKENKDLDIGNKKKTQKNILPKDKQQQEKFDSTERGRYYSNERDSVMSEKNVINENEFRKEPQGLDQILLAGQKVKKRERKVSNLSLLMAEESPKNQAPQDKKVKNFNVRANSLQ